MHNGKRCLGNCTFLTKVAKMICTRQLSSTNKTVELVDSKTNGDLSRSKSESMNADENLLSDKRCLVGFCSRSSTAGLKVELCRLLEEKKSAVLSEERKIRRQNYSTSPACFTIWEGSWRLCEFWVMRSAIVLKTLCRRLILSGEV
ncbi:hypothetical protein ES332_D03G040000v1 [Gossypium tomentosum]|uniref:Uncharacterized protein n=1 Tax=Gossypium tomentosum TaxID=34277 RepID=A0A5D2LKD0_GOSTO|nr:hypothetical protein ES332_D03G040000v1 [Gossypium tomentosum]